MKSLRTVSLVSNFTDSYKKECKREGLNVWRGRNTKNEFEKKARFECIFRN